MSAVLGVIIAIYLAMLLLLFAVQRNLLYVPNTERPDLAASGLGPIMQAITTTTADGLSPLSWYRPAPGNPRRVIVYFHGNAGHIGHRVERVRPYLDAGYGVMLVGYRGYGGNPGRPTEVGLYAEARATLEFLMQRGFAPGQMVFYGESLGTGVAVQMAVEHDCAALVLEAPLTSVADVAQSRYWIFPVRYLVLDKFDSLAKIRRVRCPLLVMHGEHDRVVPIRFGRKLYQSAPEPKEAKWFPDGTHTNFDELGGAAAVLDFLARHRLRE
jgi:fermentation-respiration switch protein FrsA (DUF1100 family)